MDKYFTNYEQSLELKQLGFNEPCFGCYFHNNKDVVEYNPDGIPFNHNNRKSRISAPLKSQVFEWFRDKHNILANVYSNASGYLYEWHDAVGGTHRGWSDYEGPNDSGVWDTYKEAEDACIDKLIEIIKQKQNA